MSTDNDAHSLSWKLSCLVSCILVWLLSPVLVNECRAADGEPNFYAMSIEELMDVPIVVSAARQNQTLGELSVPVSVVTAEDIHRSGLTSIAEILQFVPGVDVLQFERGTYYAVGIHGLHDIISRQF